MKQDYSGGAGDLGNLKQATPPEDLDRFYDAVLTVRAEI